MTALAYTDAELDTMARTIWGEARGEAFAGKVAVAWVIRNRVEHPRWWGRGIAEVCMKPFQFSCWNPGDPNEKKCRAVSADDPAFVECLAAARACLEGKLPDPTNGSDHYHVDAGEPPYWAKGRAPLVAIGRHEFYKLRSP